MSTVRISTKRGYEITAAPDTELTVWRGARHATVRAIEVRGDDWLRLPLAPATPIDVVPALPAAPVVDVRASAYTVPARLDAGVAELFGLIVADGTIFKDGKGIRLVKRHQSVVDRFARLVKQAFGYTAKVGDHTGTPSADVHSALIARWLLAVGGMAPNAKAVPPVVLRAPVSMQAAFLRGLFEDGTVNRRSDTVDHITWDNYDYKVVGVVQEMLLGHGIVSSRRWHHNIGSLYLYSQHAARFAERIGFVAAEKNELLDGARFGEDRHCLIPISRRELAPIEPRMGVSDKQNARRNGYLSRSKATAYSVPPGPGSDLLVERLRWHYEPVLTAGVVAAGASRG